MLSFISLFDMCTYVLLFLMSFQPKTLAMGTKLAPSFTNLFMGDFENKFVLSYPLQPLLWFRYIDDICTMWPHGQTTFESFLDHLITCHKTIKFTADISPTHAIFLDTKVWATPDGSIPENREWPDTKKSEKIQVPKTSPVTL